MYILPQGNEKCTFYLKENNSPPRYIERCKGPLEAPAALAGHEARAGWFFLRPEIREKTKKDMLPCLWCCHHRNFAFHAVVSFN